MITTRSDHTATSTMSIHVLGMKYIGYNLSFLRKLITCKPSVKTATNYTLCACEHCCGQFICIYRGLKNTNLIALLCLQIFLRPFKNYQKRPSCPKVLRHSPLSTFHTLEKEQVINCVRSIATSSYTIIYMSHYMLLISGVYQ